MPKFKYKAKKGINEIVEGVIFADNEANASKKLSEQSLFPIEVKPQNSDVSSRKGLSFLKQDKVRTKDILLFTQKLATLSRAKMELLPSLKVLYDQSDNLAFKNIILKVYNKIKEGEVFSECLQRFPELFPPLFISIIKAGEATGSMGEALTQLTSFMQTQESLKGKVRGALVYPSILAFIGCVSIGIILNFVVPRLKVMFVDLGDKIPIMTKIILKTSDFTTQYGSGVILFAAVVALIFYYRGAKIFGRFFKRLLRRLPIIKNLLQNQELASFSRSFSLLISRGVTPLQSLEIASLSIRSANIGKELKEATKMIREGQSIFESMSNFKSFPSFFIKMIEIGEESGRLEEVLSEVADSYNNQVEENIAMVTSVLEPVLILSIGVVLGGIVLAILLPIFQITQMVR